MALNKLTLNLDGNDDLKELLATKAPGDSVEFSVTAAIDEVTPDQAVFSVTDATAISDDEPESEEEEGGEEGELAAPEEAETPAVMMAFGKPEDDEEDAT